MTDQDLIYRIGITLVKGIGNITAKQIIETLGDASPLFTEKKHLLEKIPGLSRRIIGEIYQPEVLQRAEKEIRFLEKSKNKALFITDPAYPQRLKECVDAPVMLYFRGNTHLNGEKIIGIVGTRNATAYGREVGEQLIRDVREKFPDTLIVSGLAYGIDIISHRAALKEGLPTVGVLAHGLDRIYPAVHRNTAVEMLENGGLLTDFMSETIPDRRNFVKRNRIIAGVSDCIVVIESAGKGGALITASIADSYNKDIFAFPGRANDKYSEGCNALVKYKKAALITSADDIFREMNWIDALRLPAAQAIQRSFFPELSPEEQKVTDILAKAGNIQLNSLTIELNLPVSKLSILLFELELKGVIRCRPGGMYSLI
ncbi:MAG: DNA-processing protein DprA [Dysgonamonadaceae bacterium]|jgi:DNA processing protein|nr:DNA-processing protein DprA [Dysgonamonadaceae bacterium]